MSSSRRLRCENRSRLDNIHFLFPPLSPIRQFQFDCTDVSRDAARSPQVGISIYSSGPSAVTAPRVTAAEMYGNCTRLTYRLEVAWGLRVPSGSITGSTSNLQIPEGNSQGNPPKLTASSPSLRFPRQPPWIDAAGVDRHRETSRKVRSSAFERRFGAMYIYIYTRFYISRKAALHYALYISGWIGRVMLNSNVREVI